MAVSARSDELMLQPVQNVYINPDYCFHSPHIFLGLDRKVNGILLKIFNFLDFEDYLSACQVNKHLYKVLTDVHREVKEDVTLFKNQVDRLFNVRKFNRFDYVILESAFVRVDTIKMNVFTFDPSLPNRSTSANVALLCQNDEKIILDLSDACKKVIFEVSNRPPHYNCVDFIMDCVGKYDEKKPNTFRGPWKREPLIEATLFPGDIVALCHSNEYIHFAIYAENGIYLSKLGVDYEGILPFTLKSMMKGYGADLAYKITLRNMHNLLPNVLAIK